MTVRTWESLFRPDPPTDRQEAFAERIADVLEIELPEEHTKEAYREFIHDNIEDFREMQCDEEEYPFIEFW